MLHAEIAASFAEVQGEQKAWPAHKKQYLHFATHTSVPRQQCLDLGLSTGTPWRKGNEALIAQQKLPLIFQRSFTQASGKDLRGLRRKYNFQCFPLTLQQSWMQKSAWKLWREEINHLLAKQVPTELVWLFIHSFSLFFHQKGCSLSSHNTWKKDNSEFQP